MVFVNFSNSYLRWLLESRYYFANHYAQMMRAISLLGPLCASLEARRYTQPERARLRAAAVLDIDEVVLANIHANTFSGPGVDFHAADHYMAPDGRPWPRDDCRLNPILPGVPELIYALAKKNIDVYFVTGRREHLREETLENFRYVGLPVPAADHLVMMQADDARSVQQYKEEARKAISETRNILVVMGDQASDLGLYGDCQFQFWNPFYFA